MRILLDTNAYSDLARGHPGDTGSLDVRVGVTSPGTVTDTGTGTISIIFAFAIVFAIADVLLVTDFLFRRLAGGFGYVR